MSNRKKGQTEHPTEDEEPNPLQKLHGFFSHHVGRRIDEVRKGLAEWIHPEGERISDKHRSDPEHTNHNPREEGYDDDDDEEGEALPLPLQRREVINHHSAPSAPRPPPSTSSSPSVAGSRNGGAPSRPSSHGSQATIAPASTDLSEEEIQQYTNLAKSFKDWTLSPFKQVTPIDIFKLYKLIDNNNTQEWLRERKKLSEVMKSNVLTATKNETKYEKLCDDFDKWHQKQLYILREGTLRHELQVSQTPQAEKAARTALEKFQREKNNQDLANFTKPPHIPQKRK